jgi:excisionase family DNA binding protein
MSVAREVMTPREVARVIGWSRSTVEKWLAAGILPGRRVNQRWVVTQADLIRDGWLRPTDGAVEPGDRRR